jgi:hypothetical protein
MRYQLLPILSFYFYNNKLSCAKVDDINKKLDILLENRSVKHTALSKIDLIQIIQNV